LGITTNKNSSICWRSIITTFFSSYTICKWMWTFNWIKSFTIIS